MIKTLILDAEQMVVRYRETMMEHLNARQDDEHPEEFAGDVIAFGQAIIDMSSKDTKRALTAFRRELRAGFTMMMLGDEEFMQIERWYDDEEAYQVAIFKTDGTPVGLLAKDDVSW